MTAFVGFFGTAADALSRVEARASYLFAPVLHLSFTGNFALGYASGALAESFFFCPAHLLLAAHTDFQSGEATLQNLFTLYRRYGRHLRAHIFSPLAFALYDSRRGVALLGATGEKRCYVEEQKDGIWFSSVPHLLRAPCAVELAVLRHKK